MQTQTQTQNWLEGFLSIYDFSPSVTNPYEGKDSVEQSLAQHWNTVGGYLQDAMNDFDHEQKNQHR